MDATTNTATVPAEPQPATATATTTLANAVVKRRAKGKVAKLKLATRGFRPGTTVGAVEAVSNVYSVVFGIPVSNAVGSADEISQAHRYAVGLDALAQVESVGVVEKVGIANGTVDVMLKLAVPSDFPTEPTDQQKDDLVATAFTKIRQFMTDAEALKTRPGRRPATWKFKLNGSVLEEGRF